MGKVADPNLLRLPEISAQAVVLVQAVEEQDRRGLLLHHEERRQATREAREGEPPESKWIPRRAQALTGRLSELLPFLPRLLRWTRPGGGLLLPVGVVAFGLGLVSQALESGGGDRVVQVLAVPLLALVAWNVVLLPLLLIRRWVPLGGLGHPITDGVLGVWIHRLRRRMANSGRRRFSSGDDPEQQELVDSALEAYLNAWLPVVLPLAAARLRRLLHVAAGLLVAGVVAGMYLRGLVLEYRVTWESTFLGTEAAQRVLDTVLAPASLVLGTTVPDVAPLRAPASGLAAPWIHLYAATAVLFVLLPRLLFVLSESFSVARARRRLKVRLGEAYRRRLWASSERSERRVEVVPYSFRPAAQGLENLKRLLYDFFGPRTEVRVWSKLDYGTRAEASEVLAGRCLVVLFNLAQTPESEVHGEFLADLAAQLDDGQALVPLVDGTAYRRRLHGEDPAAAEGSQRLIDRRRGWDRVFRERDLTALHLDLDLEPGDSALMAFPRAAWPEGALKDS